jgi:penicillin-binding protein-related factor A (putative recombinase)
LRKEIEMMELDDKTKKLAEKKSQKIEFLGEKEKIEHLLQIAREKGVTFAIEVAKKMNEPYLLDILHDTLAQEGFYKKIGQSTDDDNDDNKN